MGTAVVTTNPLEAERLIAEADAYAEFVLATERHGRVGEIRLMARDWPRRGRRCTNLTHGTEWFDVTADSLVDVGFVSLTIV